MTQSSILDAVIACYLNSYNFNGLNITDEIDRYSKEELSLLVNQGLIELRTSANDVNPHIRRRTKSQISVFAAEEKLNDGRIVYLYPTALALDGIEMPEKYRSKPFAQKLARGAAQLDVVYFDLEVLERFQNNPKYIFEKSDFSVRLSTHAPYADDPQAIYFQSLGYGVKVSESSEAKANLASPHSRCVAALLLDMNKLSAYQQTFWSSFEVTDTTQLSPHPIWYNNQLGEWIENIGWSSFIMSLLQDINKLTRNIWGGPMFRSDALPPEFGWLLRPTLKEWNDFVSLFDKLVSDNLNTKFFTQNVGLNGAPAAGKTLQLLEDFFVHCNNSTNDAKAIVKPFRNLRTARSKPAHHTAVNQYDWTLYEKQVFLVRDVVTSLEALRDWLLTQPGAENEKASHTRDEVVWY